MDELHLQALKLVVESGCASMSALQRKLSVGYNKAGKIMEWLEENKYVAPFDGDCKRKVLITKEEFEEKFGELLKETQGDEQKPDKKQNKKPNESPKTVDGENAEPTQTDPTSTEPIPQDELWLDALRICIKSNSASISMLQRKLNVGYLRAGRLIEWLEENGYISAFDGAKARKVLITKEEFEEKFGKL